MKDIRGLYSEAGLMEPPRFPAGRFEPVDASAERREAFITEIEGAPAKLRQAVAGLSTEQLDTRYKNWTIRQIVHHLPDSHVHIYVRFKWALTEDQPTIKAYDEGRWSALDDARTGALEPPLALFKAVHARWAQLLRSLSDEQFGRSFIHPESGETVRLSSALAYYAWHCRHHTGQILWLREHHKWQN